MKDSTDKKKLRLITLASVVVMLIVWEICALSLCSEQIMPGLVLTFKSTVYLFTEKGFLLAVGSTVLRGLIGFAVAIVSGVALGIAGGISTKADTFLKPWVVVMRSTPVVAFILLALIWFESDRVPVFIGMLTMFPMVYTNIATGMRNVDSKLVDMARFYRVNRRRVITDVYIPSIAPFAVSGISSAVGIGWRAIIVGEVLSQPRYGIGASMHTAQSFLQVDKLIAWTVVAVILSYLFEFLIRRTEKSILKWKQS